MKTIRQARRAAGMTQEQLASALGVTQGAVAQWEAGLVHPSVKLLKPLAVALGITVDELLTEAADEASND